MPWPRLVGDVRRRAIRVISIISAMEAGAVLEIPETHYARSPDGLRLAYQQFGDGPPLLIVPALVTNIELEWEHELIRRARERLARHMTVLQFDKRGMGLSDRFERAPTLEERVEDIVCVMDEVGWERANLLGISEGGVMSQVFAAELPERIDRVVLLNTFGSRRHVRQMLENVRDGDPPLRPLDDLHATFMGIAESWSEEPRPMVDLMMPSQLDNESFARWVGRFQRFACSPRDFVTQLDAAFALDPGDAAERITSPTLVMHVTGDRALHVSGGRTLAEIIPGASYLELGGEDHYAWIMPTWRDVVDGIIRFCTGSTVEHGTTRQFGTVMFTDIVDSTRRSSAVGDQAWRDILDGHDRITRALVDEHGGRVVKSTGDGLLALFSMPSQSVTCGLAMLAQLRGIGLEVRAGLHAGELEVRDDGDVSGLAVNLAARVEQSARDGELWASSTVRDMTLGGGVDFADEGEHSLKGIDGRWRLFSASTG